MMRAWLLLAAVLALPLLGAAKPAGQDLTAAGQTFVKQLADGQFAAAESTFDDTMKAAMPPDKLQAAWQQIVGKVGAFQEQTAVRQVEQAPYRVVLVTCRFEKATLEARVVYDTEGRISGLWFGSPQPAQEQFGAPPYADRSAFAEKDVTVGAGGEWALPGTLSLPNGTGPFPAVVLVHGSGPQDRDETIYANKPFRDLAWGLASRGVAVLRYEKRTQAYQTKMMAAEHITVKEETVDDAAAAVALLTKTDGIDPKRIFVLGHSLGGMLVPRIAKAAPQAAGFIIMAGTTRPLEDVVIGQLDYLTSLAGGNLAPQAEEKVDAMRKEADEVKALKPEDAGSDKRLLAAPVSYWLDLRDYHPAEAAKAIERPMLILQGGRDYQVTMADYDGWKAALDGRPNVTFKLYPALNHLFIAGEGASTPAQYHQPGHVDRHVVADIADWVEAH